MDTLKLTRKLVSIPYYLGKNCDEQKIGQFIFDYLTKNTCLTVIKEQVENGRFNVIATDNSPAKILFCGHIDTVEPKGKFEESYVANSNLYGLGSSDMKCTLACMLSTAKKIEKTKGIMWLFYVDEEYDFAGMTQFIKDYKNKMKPTLIVGEGTDNQIRNGCRGLIEIKFTAKGKTGHASRPENGNNAILGSQLIFEKLTKIVNSFSDPEIGSSSINLASINGGLNLGERQIGRQGNNIADYCEFIIDVRTATNKLRAKTLVESAKLAAARNNLKLEFAIRHDKLGWFSPISALPKYIIDKYPIWSDFRTGYVDTQMLYETFKCPCFGFGAGPTNRAHRPCESVPIKNLEICEKFYIDLIQTMKGGEK